MSNKHIITTVNDGVTSGVYQQAELLVASQGEIQLHHQAGQNQDLYFDLASLTKPLCTAFLCMLLHQEELLDVHGNLSDFYVSKTLKQTSIKSLLNHTSGLIAWAPLYSNFLNNTALSHNDIRRHYLEAILNDENLFGQSEKTTYSDLGYILLGRLIEKISGYKLDHVFKSEITNKLSISESLFFQNLEQPTHPIGNPKFAASEECNLRHKTIKGEVMDRNAWVQGGVSGHAGLFGTTQAISKILSEWRLASFGQSELISQEAFELFCIPDNQASQKEYFTLGFDTPTKGVSQSGDLFSEKTIGHLGYAGTSFWWDLKNDFWIILLTNRCMPDRKNFKIQQFRPALHNQIITEFKLNSI